jgi:outer membrane protein assembly factor BamB
MSIKFAPGAAALALIGSLLSAVALHAENWPQWRGPRNDGVSHEKDLPVRWSKTENIAWRLPLPGPGGATPIIWDERIFATSVDGEGQLLLLCVGTDGKEQWRQVVGQGNRDVRGDEGNSAAPSPSTDGKHVWTFMANGLLACYTMTGEEVWKFNLQDRYGKFKIAFGMTATPVLDRGRLYVQLIHGEGRAETQEAQVVCLDGASGSEIWRQLRPSDAVKECKHSYASPMLYRDGEREFLLSHGADYVIAHSLEDGRELWRCGGLNPYGSYNPTLRFVASPLATPGMIVVPSAKRGPVFAIKPDANGDITEKASAFLWKLDENTPDVPSPVLYDGLVYLCRENGNLMCVAAKTGELLYEERSTSDRHRASPLAADGKIYTTARNGVVTVTKAGRSFEILAQNDLGEDMSASPAVSNGRIYLRTFEALYAIGK